MQSLSEEMKMNHNPNPSRRVVRVLVWAFVTMVVLAILLSIPTYWDWIWAR